MKQRHLFSFLAAAMATITLFGSSLWAQTRFIPNDPYYSSNATGLAQSGYYGQWYLRNEMPVSSVNAGFDANLWGAWQRGLTGEGVVIGIVDDGVQGNHPDLVAKFINGYSWDYLLDAETNRTQTYRGSPVGNYDSHGTSVAGVAVATGGNGIGITGAAPLAGLASQRLYSGTGTSSSQQDQVWAIGFQGQVNGSGQLDPSVPFTGSVAPVRVMNHSYGQKGGYSKDPGWELLYPALAASAEKKVIHVISAGNERDEYTNQDANANFQNTSPNVIVVAALGSDGKYASYSSFGANVLVTAPSSSSDPQGLYSVSTIDRTGTAGYNNYEILHPKNGPPGNPDPYFSPVGTGNLADYDSTFGGTSASAPLVSGIMALGVQANANLDLRMARHLLAQTSVKIDPTQADWITNGAGYHFNKNYGFGLIDADAFTQKATEVQSMSAAELFGPNGATVLQNKVFGANARTISETISINKADGLFQMEYVQVKLSLSGFQTEGEAYKNGIGACLGDISGTLTSAAGTRYQLFANDRNLTGANAENRFGGNDLSGTLEWTFTSYAYFGEEINGNWILELGNGSTNTDYTKFGQWDSYEMSFGLGSIAMVPEPSALSLLAVGIGGLAMMRRRRS
jgi:subtilisin family serine protease